MALKFTARQPKPRKAAVDPLTASPEAAESADPKALQGKSNEDKSAAKVSAQEESAGKKPSGEKAPKELGGPSGPEPTRYGDWERKGICVDF
ncbi:DUF1674 domain-containing protein [Pelagibius litoralis]|uniref:DUF1674 domain-containing protein n=1 Tax=Pelagibius litoralis TaxID=374515 RepID=A0A967F0X3_9PROT|nr:DUF1674 domain-containing protein [Pelagibius litoralis]NIA71034.1 DUF1674 domain-containing protein [Pelagibius litoralis]